MLPIESTLLSLKQNIKKKYAQTALFIFIVSISTGILLSNCNKPQIKSWEIYLDNLGTGSSPHMADLTGDGILDIVMGVGGKENYPTDTGVIALDGTNGKMLWHLPARNQMVGSALFKDITGDNIPDVFIGGRSAELIAINGSNGKTIWNFFPQGKTINPADSGWFNFLSPQFIPDQDKDGLEDLLIGNGGNYLIKPYDTNRPTGNLLVISSTTGKILAKAKVPDGKETYFSVIVTDLHQNNNPVIIFGTGGETIGGNLYRTTLKDLMQNDISNARILASGANKGFIAPAIFADITRDGTLDIIANAVEGRLIAINGVTDSLIWEVLIPGTEAYSSPSIGYFNNDSIPDFFANYGIGTWPNIQQSVQFMVDGKTGLIQLRDTLGSFQYASSVVADFNADGFDDALLGINSVGEDFSRFSGIRLSHLLVFDFHNHTYFPLGDTLMGINIASTPWVGAMKENGSLNIVYSTTDFLKINNDINDPAGLYIKAIQTTIPVKKPIEWGAYMGSQYNGIFSVRNTTKNQIQ